MTNNSKALQNLVKSAESVKRENERIMSEITQQSLRELNKNLTNSFNQRLDNVQVEFENFIKLHSNTIDTLNTNIQNLVSNVALLQKRMNEMKNIVEILTNKLKDNG